MKRYTAAGGLLKTLFRSLALCGWATAISSAQTIPNAGFETWAAGNPTDWLASNILTIYVPVTQSTGARGGSFAVQGTVVPTPTGTGYTPILAAGVDGGGFPINFRPEALHGWYKFSSDSGDAFSATLGLTKEGASIGAGIFYSPTQYSAYSEFVVNVTYISDDIPDEASILILIANSQPAHVGSSFTLDDLSFGPATTDVKEAGTGKPYSFALDQNYPNPFNPSTKIQFQIPEAQFVTLKVYNLLGQEVSTLVNEQLQGGSYRAEFDGSNLPSGTYFYRLQAGGFSEVKKMAIAK